MFLSKHIASCATAVCIIAVAAKLFAMEPVDLRPNRPSYHIGTQIEFLEDPTGILSLSDVSSPSISKRFRLSNEERLNLGYTRSAYWIRFSLQNRTNERIGVYIHIPYPLLDDIRLYEPLDNGRLRERKTGRFYPFDSKEIPTRHFNFAIEVPPKSAKTYYMRFASKDSLVIPIELHLRESLAATLHQDQLMMGLYYGIIIIMILYNILILITTRDINYLYYVLSLTFLHLLFQAGINGLSFEYIGRDSLWWSRTSIAFMFSLGAAFSVQFCRSFINTRRTAPIIDYFLIGGLVWGAIEALISCTVDYFYAIQSIVVYGEYVGALLWITGLVSLLRGNRASRFYLLAWTSLIFGGLTYSLKVWGFIPSTFLTEYAWQIGSTIQAFLLAMALGDHINILRQEKLEAQKAALEKEREAREAQERFSERLERLVEERTEELHSALLELRQRDALIQKELDLASGIQRSILPETPRRFNGIAITSYYRAIEKIGGDFFDIFTVRGGYVNIIIADAAGHGIPAAFVTALAKISFAEATRQYIFPRDVLRHVNAQLIKVLKSQFYLTAFLMSIGPSLEVYYANASHQRAIVARKRDGSIEEWDTPGLFVGATTEADGLYEDRQDKLDFGDRIILYTDGLVEARNSDGIEFGQKRVRALMEEGWDTDINGLRNRIIETWSAFTEGSQIRDDVTFIVLEVEPSYRDFLEHKNAGLYSFAQNRIDEAIRHLNAALSFEPDDPEANYLLAKCFAREKSYAAAIPHLETYLRINDDDADAWHLIAACRFNLHQYEESLNAAKRACQLRRNYLQALTIWALSLKRLGRNEETIPVWERILKIDPHNETAIKEMDRLSDKTNED